MLGARHWRDSSQHRKREGTAAGLSRGADLELEVRIVFVILLLRILSLVSACLFGPVVDPGPLGSWGLSRLSWHGAGFHKLPLPAPVPLGAPAEWCSAGRLSLGELSES